MDLFEQHILSAPIADATDNVIKLMMVADAIRKEIDYLSEQMCSDEIGETRIDELERTCNELFTRLTDYKLAIRLGESYCGIKRRKESEASLRNQADEMELVWERSADK